MSYPHTLIDVVAAHASARADVRAFGWIDEHEVLTSLSYAELDRRARALAVALQDRGMQGRPVLILQRAGIDYTCAILGCLYAGAIAVPAYPPRQHSLARAAERARAIIADARIVLAVSTAEIAAQCAGLPELAGIDWLPSDCVALADAEQWRRPDFRGETACILQYTSGSTAEPKGVVITHAQLVANQRMIASVVERTPLDGPWLNWMPPYHDFGLIGGTLHPLFAGATALHLGAETFLRRPLAWLRAISHYRASVTSGPSFAFRHCVQRIRPEQRVELDLSSLRVVWNGAEPIDASTLDAFSSAFEPHGFDRRAFYPSYGMAETTLLFSGGPLERGPKLVSFSTEQLAHGHARRARDGEPARCMVGCGAAIGGGRFEIVDPERGLALEPGSVGEIWLTSPSVASGYWNRLDATEHTFAAHLTDTHEGPFLRTGDLGFVYEGELFISGRLKDLIVVRGQKHHPQDIERTVQRVDPALLADTGAAFGVSVDDEERVVVVQELDHRAGRDPHALLDPILETIREQHELAAHAVVLLKKGSLLKTSSGKVRRSAMRAAFLGGELSVVARWDAPRTTTDSADSQRASRTWTRPVPLDPRAEAIATFLRERLAERFGLHPSSIDDTAPLARYGVDSVMAVELTDALCTRFDVTLPSTITYDNPTIAGLARALCTEAGSRPTTRAGAHGSASAGARRSPGAAAPLDDAIAIVGMSCRFPGAPDLRAYHDLLRHGVDAITEIPESHFSLDGLYDPDADAPGKIATRWGGFIEDIDRFDPSFFGISRREATLMDPQQRLFLELSWEALEDAGIAPSTLAGTQTGVFAGASSGDFTLLLGRHPQLVDADYGTGNAKSLIANRLSYFLDLRGPSMTIDAACASSLVALAHATTALRRGELTHAIVGGVNALLTPEPFVFFSKAHALAKDGRCKAFDARADGFVRGEGGGVVILQRVSDAVRARNRIYAVVAGSAVNHDGASNGIMAPSGPAQERLLRSAFADAGIGPEDVDYIETHGVGTPLADTVEARAIGAVLDGHARERPCLLGAVKSNIGHLEAASGMASVIKAALALHGEEIPPNLHLRDVHPDIDVARWSLTFPTVPTRWPRGDRTRYAGASSFGFGGTNAHVVLGEAPLQRHVEPRAEEHRERSVHLLTLSARTANALQRQRQRWARRLDRLALPDLCFTASTGRAHFPVRAAFIADSNEALQRQLLRSDTPSERMGAAGASEPPLQLALIFRERPIYTGTGATLFECEPEFRRALLHADDVLRQHVAVPPSAALFDTPAGALVSDALGPTCAAALDHALFMLLRSWGVTPACVLGQGAGEYLAACAAGVMAWEDALVTVAQRAALRASFHAGAPLTGTPRDLKAVLRSIKYRAPTIPFVSGSVGRAWRADEVPGSAHFSAHIYHEHRPDEGLAALDALDPTLCFDLGAHGSRSATRFALLADHHDAHPPLLTALAAFYVAGGNVDWNAFESGRARHKVSLPSYPFERQRYWPAPLDAARATPSEPPARETGERASEVRALAHPLLSRRRVISADEQSSVVRLAVEDETG